MISNLESNNVDHFDPVSFAGKLALLGGAGYATYKTFGQIPSISPAGAITGPKTLQSKLAKIMSVAATSHKSVIGYNEATAGSRVVDFITSEEGRNTIWGHENVFSKLNPQLRHEMDTLLNEVRGTYGYGENVAIKGTMFGKKLTQVSIIPHNRESLRVNPVINNRIYTGYNNPTSAEARQLWDWRSNPIQGEVVESDIFTARRYRQELDKFLPKFGEKSFVGGTSAADIHRTVTGKAVWEGKSFLANVPTEGSIYRHHEVVGDGYGALNSYPTKGENQVAALVNRMLNKGFYPGSAQMTAAGIVYAPDVPFASLPGAMFSPQAKSILKPSKFINHTDKGFVHHIPGAPDAFDFFDVAVVDKKDLAQLQTLAKERLTFIRAQKGMYKEDVLSKLYGPGLHKEEKYLKSILFGELSPEESILDTYSDLQIQNNLYRRSVSSGQTSVEFENMLNKIANRTSLSKADISQHIASGSLGDLLSNKNINYDMAGMILGGAPGLPGEEAISRVPSGTQNFLKNITLKDKNILNVELTSQAPGAVGMKTFGLKTVTKAKLSTTDLLTQLDYVKKHGRLGSASELGLGKHGWGQKGRPTFVVNEHPFKNLLDSNLENLSSKEGIQFFANLFENAHMKHAQMVEAGQSGAIYESFFNEMGYVKSGANWENSGKLTAKQMLSSFRSFREKNPSFVRDTIGDASRLRLIMSPDLHMSQMGAGNLGFFSERAFMNVATMFPEDVAQAIRSRQVVHPVTPDVQLLEMTKYRSSLFNKQGEAINLEDLKGHYKSREALLNDLFSADKSKRQMVLEGRIPAGQKYASISLGEELLGKGMKPGEGVRNVIVSLDENMVPYFGQQIGSHTGITPADRAAKDLLSFIGPGRGNYSHEMAQEYLSTYLQSFDQIQNTLRKKINAGAFRGSITSRASSELPYMREFASQFPKTLSGRAIPTVGVHEKDIRGVAGDIITNEMLNPDSIQNLKTQLTGGLLTETGYERRLLALKRKEAVRQLREGMWSLALREPVEDYQRIMPVMAGSAEKMGVQQYTPGMVYFSGEEMKTQDKFFDVMRQAFGLDFDADNPAVHFFPDKKIGQHFHDFWTGAKNDVGRMGTEFQKSLDWFELYALKGKGDVNLFTTEIEKLTQLSAATGQLEKGMIGPLSAEFKKMHAGYRAQFVGDLSSANMANVFKGEAFALTLVETGLKAKHQSMAALLGDNYNILDIFKSNRSIEDKTAAIQAMFDSISFKDAGLGARIRAGERPLAEIGAQIKDIGGKESMFAKLYAEMTGVENIRSMFRAHARGAAMGDITMEVLRGGEAGLGSISRSMGAEAREIVSIGMKNVVKYGLIPAAGIGLIGALFMNGAGKESLPVQIGADSHSSPEVTEATTPSASIWLRKKKERLRVSAQADESIDPNRLAGQLQRSNVHVSYNDYRRHMNQNIIDRMVTRGR